MQCGVINISKAKREEEKRQMRQAIKTKRSGKNISQTGFIKINFFFFFFGFELIKKLLCGLTLKFKM